MAARGGSEVAACCFGVPIFGSAGNVVGAISLAGPQERMTNAGLHEIREALLHASQAVTRELGGIWPELAQPDEDKERTRCT